MTIHQEEQPSKRRYFNRNPSIEKIIRFNAYICSQNFFILPAILAWLRTSQSVLRSYSEKCTTSLKIFAMESIRIAEEVYRNPSGSVFGKKLLEVSTYACLLVVVLQFGTCLTLLGLNPLPGGLLFMLGAVSYISYMNYLCLRLIIIRQKYKDEHEKNFENEATTKYIRPKDILGKRTISSLNLF